MRDFTKGGFLVHRSRKERRTKETGLHPKRLRKLLDASGMLPEGSADLVDGNCLFDAQRASTLVLDASDGTRQIISDWTNYDGSAI